MIIIEIKSESPYGSLAIPRTAIYVNGQFAYQSGNAVAIEHEHLKKLVKLLGYEDKITVRSVYK